MKNYILSTIAIFAFIGAQAQVKVNQGNNSQEFKTIKQPKFSSFSDDNANYFIIKRVEHFEKINTLIVADKTGSINIDKEIRINRGTFNNNAEVNSLLVAGNSIVAFVESRSKDNGKNTLTARIVDKNGTISNTDLPVGSIDFVKMSNAGDWYTTVTPDKKHIAVVGRLPHEKNMPDQFKYFLLDETLKVTGTGQFSFAGYTKEISVWNFLASDKGDLYIISEEFDKSYKYPVVYQAKAGSATGSIIPVIIADPALRVLNYVSGVNPAGDLVIAGYSQQKKTFSMGDVQAVGTWLFNSSKPQEVKTFKFDKPITNMTARNIVYNGDTFFMVGEQYKEEKEPNRETGMAALNAEENFNYEHGDIVVTAFGGDGNKKFDLPVSRNNWKSRNVDQQFMVASGIINNKLAIVFNDIYGKYIDDKYYKNYKLPVAITINNDGLMDAPVHFAKELDVKLSTYTLLPLFSSAGGNRLVLLTGNEQSVKTVTFQ
ncbi:hypothetical protein [Mucilaginibacter sp.]|uniref:hypothetical protein n=1 Tax=Mucilaginibacter sp. TaxID=1882438 RepID=UPI0025D94026|nr:hypothetical protein [Mucilaginibacter sp.]